MALIKLPGSKNYHASPKKEDVSGDRKNADAIEVSSVEIGLRTEKSDENKYSWQIVDDIPYDEPCVLYVGGDGSSNDRAANGNAKIIEQDILKPLGEKVPVYSVKYNFLQSGAGDSRNIAFMKHRAEALHDRQAREKEFTEGAAKDDFQPQYIDKLYKAVIEPRISITHGKGKLSVQEACRRMRMITFVAHCHGGYVMLELEKKMRAEMQRLGYSLAERKQILSQMLTVAHSPACALGVAKSQMVSFMSVRDVEFPKRSNRLGNNFFNNYLFNRYHEHKIHLQAVQDGDEKRATEYRPFDLKPCYFAPQQGNLFLIQEKNKRANDEIFMFDKTEHGDIGYGYAGKTPAGQMITYVASNIIKNGIKNSILQKNGFTPLPKLEELILGDSVQANDALNKLFPKMIENGRALRQEIYHFASLNKHKYTKTS